MQIITGGGGCGKTTELIRLCARHGGYIVTRNQILAIDIQQHAIKLGLNIPLPITYSEFLSGKYCGKNIKNFYIDDVDVMISQFANGVNINAVTFSSEQIRKFDL